MKFTFTFKLSSLLLLLLLISTLCSCAEALATAETSAAASHLAFRAPPFQWKNCDRGGSGLSSLKVSPHPVRPGSDVRIEFAGRLSEDIDWHSGHSLHLLFQKKLFGVFVNVPCVDGIGSCTIPNVCSLFGSTPHGCYETSSSNLRFDVPCGCPFPARSYAVFSPGISFSLPSFGDFKWLAEGEFRMQATIKDKHGKEIACLDTDFSIAPSK
ncbi:Ganglioside GM2 activator [Balamuthia mandrillaris]